MKQFIILIAFLFASVAQVYAQQAANSRYSDNYTGAYYYPVMHGPNGFLTVEQENRLMDEIIAEKRRQRQQDEMTQDEIARAVKKHNEEEAAHRKMYGDKKEEQKPKK